MDDVLFAARRAATMANRPHLIARGEVSARFRTLVQSPLRAGIIRQLHANPTEAYELEALT